MKTMLQITSKAFTVVLILLVLQSCKTLQQQSQSSAPPSIPSPSSSPSASPPSMPSPSTAGIPNPTSMPSTDSSSKGKQGDQRKPSSTASAEESAPAAKTGSSSPAANEAAEILQTASQQAQQAASTLPPEMPVTDEQESGEGEWDPLLIQEESSSSADTSSDTSQESASGASEASQESASAESSEGASGQPQDSRAAEILGDIADVLSEASDAAAQGETDMAEILANARIRIMVAQSQLPSLPQAQMEVLADVLGDLDQSILLAGEVLVAGSMEFPPGSEGDSGDGSEQSGRAAEIFDESLVIFDGEIAKVRQESVDGTRINVGTIGIPSSSGNGDDRDDGDSLGESSDPGTPIDIAGKGTALPPDPNDIPDGRDDDIVARQLRELAESETDPELKAKYWEEYKKYKAGAT